MKTLITLYFIFFSFNVYSQDISIEKVELWYLDNITDPKTPKVRKLSSLQDDTFWSKPDYVDIEVIIKNNGKTTVKYTNIAVELYHLLSHREDGPEYSSIPGELKTITNNPVWIWTTNLVHGMVQNIKPGETKTIIYKNNKVKGQFYATDYSFGAFAVKVFASPRDGDKNYKNNSNYKIVHYGD